MFKPKKNYQFSETEINPLLLSRSHLKSLMNARKTTENMINKLQSYLDNSNYMDSDGNICQELQLLVGKSGNIVGAIHKLNTSLAKIFNAELDVIAKIESQKMSMAEEDFFYGPKDRYMAMIRDFLKRYDRDKEVEEIGISRAGDGVFIIRQDLNNEEYRDKLVEKYRQMEREEVEIKAIIKEFREKKRQNNNNNSSSHNNQDNISGNMLEDNSTNNNLLKHKLFKSKYIYEDLYIAILKEAGRYDLVEEYNESEHIEPKYARLIDKNFPTSNAKEDDDFFDLEKKRLKQWYDIKWNEENIDVEKIADKIISDQKIQQQLKKESLYEDKEIHFITTEEELDYYDYQRPEPVSKSKGALPFFLNSINNDNFQITDKEIYGPFYKMIASDIIDDDAINSNDYIDPRDNIAEEDKKYFGNGMIWDYTPPYAIKHDLKLDKLFPVLGPFKYSG